MSIWDNIVDGFTSGMMRKGPNYVAKQRAARAQLEGLMAVAIRRAYQDFRTEQARGRRELQYRDGDLEVRVRSDYNRDHDCDVTDIVVIPRHDNPRGSHQHVIIDENGNELMNEWRDR